MKRITPVQKAIADAHIAAKLAKKYDDPIVRTVPEVVEALKAGKTFSTILEGMETNEVSITSQILAGSTFNHLTNAYKQAIYKGFKTFLTHHKIV